MKLLVLSFLSSIFQLRLAACCLCRASQGEKIDSLLLVGWICLLLYLDYKHINTMFSVVFCSVWAPGLLKLQELLSQTRFSSRSAAGIQPSERILFMRKSENVCTYPPRILRSINCNPQKWRTGFTFFHHLKNKLSNKKQSVYFLLQIFYYTENKTKLIYRDLFSNM